jgi:hypothetical protein
MTVKDFKEKIKKYKIKPDAELILHIEDGDFSVNTLEYDKRNSKLKICTDEWEKKNQYRIIYTILKDHTEILRTSEYNIFAATDEEILLDFDELKDKILSLNGITGEKNEKTGSISMMYPDYDYIIEDNQVVRKHVDKKHYFTCQLLEILKIIDDENNIYMRVWHN